MKFSSQRRRRRRAVTLLEIMITVALATVVSGSVVALYLFSSKVVVDLGAYNLCSQNARQSIDTLSKDLRSAVAVVESHGTFQTSTDTLVLQVPALDVDYVPIDIESCYDYVIYHPHQNNPERFMRTIVAYPESRRHSGTRQVKFGVRSVSFQSWYAAEPDALGTHVLHVQLITRRTARGKTTEMPISVSVKLRNMTNGETET